MMTVRELMIRLTQFPPDTMVVINGYEGGNTEVTGVEGVLLELNVYREWYYGPHEVTEDKEKGVFAVSIT